MDLDDTLELQVSEEELDATVPNIPNPPNSPVNETKLPFLNEVDFIIPKLNKHIKNSTGKRCIKHHTTLCRVCNLVKRAYLVQNHKLKSEAPQRHIGDPNSYGSDPNIYDNDPHIDGSDPFLLTPPLEEENQSAAAALRKDSDCLESTDSINQIDTSFESPPLPQLFDKLLELNPVKDTAQTRPMKKRRWNGKTVKNKPQKCPSCGGCTCPRGTFIPKETGGRKGPATVPHSTPMKRPSLLDIPVTRTIRQPPIPSLLDLPLVPPPRYR